MSSSKGGWLFRKQTKNVSMGISASELRSRVKEVEKYLAETFGGFTSAEKVGGYLSSKSSVITEKVVPVTAFASKEDFAKNKSKLVSKMSVWAKKWGQEAIGFEFEGDLYYVPEKLAKGGKISHPTFHKLQDRPWMIQLADRYWYKPS
jgi:hypothetical protein